MVADYVEVVCIQDMAENFGYERSTAKFLRKPMHHKVVQISIKYSVTKTLSTKHGCTALLLYNAMLRTNLTLK